jgi:protein SEY1
MGHLRTRTLEAFRESFEKALANEGFAVAARNCTETFLEKFDKGSEGMLLSAGYLYSHC